MKNRDLPVKAQVPVFVRKLNIRLGEEVIDLLGLVFQDDHVVDTAGSVGRRELSFQPEDFEDTTLETTSAVNHSEATAGGAEPHISLIVCPEVPLHNPVRVLFFAQDYCSHVEPPFLSKDFSMMLVLKQMRRLEFREFSFLAFDSFNVQKIFFSSRNSFVPCHF